jgi:hypothetical protein
MLKGKEYDDMSMYMYDLLYISYERQATLEYQNGGQIATQSTISYAFLK